MTNSQKRKLAVRLMLIVLIPTLGTAAHAAETVGADSANTTTTKPAAKPALGLAADKSCADWIATGKIDFPITWDERGQAFSVPISRAKKGATVHVCIDSPDARFVYSATGVSKRRKQRISGALNMLVGRLRSGSKALSDAKTAGLSTPAKTTAEPVRGEKKSGDKAATVPAAKPAKSELSVVLPKLTEETDARIKASLAAVEGAMGEMKKRLTAPLLGDHHQPLKEILTAYAEVEKAFTKARKEVDKLVSDGESTATIALQKKLKTALAALTKEIDPITKRVDALKAQATAGETKKRVSRSVATKAAKAAKAEAKELAELEAKLKELTAKKSTLESKRDGALKVAQEALKAAQKAQRKVLEIGEEALKSIDSHLKQASRRTFPLRVNTAATEILIRRRRLLQTVKNDKENALRHGDPAVIGTFEFNTFESRFIRTGFALGHSFLQSHTYKLGPSSTGSEVIQATREPFGQQLMPLLLLTHTWMAMDPEEEMPSTPAGKTSLAKRLGHALLGRIPTFAIGVPMNRNPLHHIVAGFHMQLATGFGLFAGMHVGLVKTLRPEFTAGSAAPLVPGGFRIEDATEERMGADWFIALSLTEAAVIRAFTGLVGDGS